jgi:hypothetical protein
METFTTFEIRSFNAERVRKRLTRIQKAAHKMGKSFAFEVSDSYQKLVELRKVDPDSDSKQKVYRSFAKVTTQTDMVQIGGYEMVGVLEKVKKGVNFVFMTNNDHYDAAYASCSMSCEHCKTRRRRKQIFILHNEEKGETVKVGSTCLEDFTGHNPAGLLLLASRWEDLRQDIFYDDHEGGFYGTPHRDPLIFLAIVVEVIEKYGWLPRSKAGFGQKSTSEIAYERCFINYDKKPEEASVEKAVEILEWARNVDPGSSSYLHNLKVAAGLQEITSKEAGLVASMVAAYQRAQANERKREQNTSEWVGEVKERIEKSVTVEGIFSTTGFYGPTTIYRFIDKAGNNYTWFSSGAAWGVKVGDEVTIKGTVKKHETYKGVKQTVLTRCIDIT